MKKDLFANAKFVTSELNKLNNTSLFYTHDKLNNSYKVFEENIKNNKSVVITYQYSNIIPNYSKKQHTISLFCFSEAV